MSAALSPALRLAGWHESGSTQHHVTGATVRSRGGAITATRADGTKRHALPDYDAARAWALGNDDVGGEPPVRLHRAGKGAIGEGWTYAYGVYRHRNGTIESGHVSGKFRARLLSGENDLFRIREDARLWVEGGGTFPAGHVRAERRGA